MKKTLTALAVAGSIATAQAQEPMLWKESTMDFLKEADTRLSRVCEQSGKTKQQCFQILYEEGRKNANVVAGRCMGAENNQERIDCVNEQTIELLKEKFQELVDKVKGPAEKDI